MSKEGLGSRASYAMADFQNAQEFNDHGTMKIKNWDP